MAGSNIKVFAGRFECVRDHFPFTVLIVVDNNKFVVVLFHIFPGGRVAQLEEHGFMILVSRVRIQARADMSRLKDGTHVPPPWHVKDLGHSAISAGG